MASENSYWLAKWLIFLLPETVTNNSIKADICVVSVLFQILFPEVEIRGSTWGEVACETLFLSVSLLASVTNYVK